MDLDKVTCRVCGYPVTDADGVLRLILIIERCADCDSNHATHLDCMPRIVRNAWLGRLNYQWN